MSKHLEKTAATRDAFVKAFFQLAEKKNIYKITVREITELAGYNRTTFYRHFMDVPAVLEYVEDQFIDEMAETVLPVLEKSQTLGDEFFQLYLEKFRERQEILEVLLRDENRTPFIKRIKDRLFQQLNSPIADTPRNAVIMDIYFTGVFHAVANQLQHPDLLTDDELMAILRSLFTNWYWKEIHE